MQKYTLRWSTVFTLLLLLAQLFVQPHPLIAQAEPPADEPIAQPFHTNSTPIPPFAPGVVLVGVRGDVVEASSTAAAMPWADLEVLAAEPLPLRFGALQGTSASTSAAEEAGPLSGYRLSVPVGTEWNTIETLSTHGEIVFAEPDWVVQIAQGDPSSSADTVAVTEAAKAVLETPFAVTDTLYDDQWYMQRIGSSRAWALALAESQGSLATIQVAVIDTGVDYTHPDLVSVLNPGRNYVEPSVPCPASATDEFDDNGHGTHVAGLVAAAMNGVGTVGPGLQVRITPYKALDCIGLGYISDIAPAIGDAVDDGTQIINLSLQLSIDSFVLGVAVQDAVAHGVLIIAASGNQGVERVSYPAAYPDVLAVGATSYSDLRAYYSNRGPELDIMAPGGLTANSILSTWTSYTGARCPAGARRVNGGNYCNAEGTSMATGIVTGAAALIMSLRPDLDADEVQEILLNSAAPLVGLPSEVGRGRLDMASAVRLALKPRLEYAAAGMVASALDGQSAFTVTLPLSNPSLARIQVELTPTITTTWSALVGPHAGEVSYGKNLDVQMVFTPTAVTVGTYYSSLRVTAKAEGGGTSIYFVNTRLNVYPTMVGSERLYLAWLGTPGESFQWAVPDSHGRTAYTIGSSSSIVVDLPFTMTVRNESYTDLRVYADGFVVASSTAFPANLPNRCLANQVWPPFAVYGWWSDLSLGLDSTLSTFQPDPDHFVVEYSRFISAGSSDPDDRVSFQIVLDRNGQIVLNYAETPEHLPAGVTVGASIIDGRYYNQIACHLSGSKQINEVPRAPQTFTFTLDDLY